MVVVLPPGEMQPLSCGDCRGTTFNLIQEVRDGQVNAFHSLCTTCGKRGYLRQEVATTVTRSFQQFADPPPMDGPSYSLISTGTADTPPGTGNRGRTT